MIFTSLLSIAALLPLISADTEVIQGYTFVKSGPKVVAPLVQYQLPTYKTATRILKDRLGPDGLLSLVSLPKVPSQSAY